MLNNPKAKNLPRGLTSLKQHVRGQLPLLKMRKKTINLIPEKLLTIVLGRKSTDSGRIPTEDLTFFNIKDVF